MLKSELNVYAGKDRQPGTIQAKAAENGSPLLFYLCPSDSVQGADINTGLPKSFSRFLS